MSYLKVLTKHIPLNNTYQDVMTFWHIQCEKEDGTYTPLNNITRDTFFRTYDKDFNNISSYIHINFPIKNGLTTSVRLTRTMLGSMMDNLSSKNYCHIIDENGLEHFYFITDIDYSVGKDIVKLNLERDVFTEYSEGLYIDRKVKYARVHCDRYSNSNGNGCDEMYVSDAMDSKFNASILNERMKLFTNKNDENKMWAIVYLSRNVPTYKSNTISYSDYPSQFQTINFVKDNNNNKLLTMTSFDSGNNLGVYYILMGFKDSDIDAFPSTYDKTNKITNIKGYAQPYIVALIPLFKTQWGFEHEYKYQKSNGEIITDTTHTTIDDYYFNKEDFFNFVNGNDYVYKVQVSTFDFSKIIAPNGYIQLNKMRVVTLPTNITSVNKNNLTPYFTENIDGRTYDGNYSYSDTLSGNVNCTSQYLISVDNFEDIINEQNIECYDLYSMVGFDYDLNSKSLKENCRSLSNSKEISIEPKLYCSPYTIYTYTSASEKEYPIEPTLLCYYGTGTLTLTFTPSPSMNGEMMFLTSGIYQYYQSNYNGTTPISSLELTTASDEYKSFLTTQRNSYFTGLGQSYFNSTISLVGNTANAIASGITNNYGSMATSIVEGIGNIGDLTFTTLQNQSKMKDLVNQPSKFNNLGFDILPMIVNTDLFKYINCYTMLPREYEQVFEYFYRFGYEVDDYREFRLDENGNIIYGGVKNAFNRGDFNYVRVTENISNYIHTQGETSTLPMDETIREKFNSIFNNGVRIWSPQTATDFLNFNIGNEEVYFK